MTVILSAIVTIWLRFSRLVPMPSDAARSQLGPITFPSDQADCQRIHEQLDRILANPLFRNSKRYPAFLRYVVTAALANRRDQLKERTLGVDVFGRAPDYDTNLDHIVRSTAGDVRRRLAQYYGEPEHSAELRIDILAGSYIPVFRPAAEPMPVAPPPPPALARPVRRNYPPMLLLASGMVLVAATAFFASLFHPRALSADQPALATFWAPVTATAGSAVLCIGSGKVAASLDPSKPSPPLSAATTLAELHRNLLDSVPFSDAVALIRVASELGRFHKPFRVLFEPEARLSDLRQGPIVLIGAFDNDWTIRFTGPLRYSLVLENFNGADGFRSSVKDGFHPNRAMGSVSWAQPYLELKEDYAIVSRVFDPTTAQPVIMAGGMTKFGTAAAGEFLSDERSMEELAKSAPKDWIKHNLQVVLATKVIRGSSGAPRILESYFW